MSPRNPYETFGRQGKRIKTIERVLWLAHRRRAVVSVNWNKHNTAAFMANMSCNVVAAFIRRGLYEYKKQEAHSGK